MTDKSIEKWATATEADLPVEVQSLIVYRSSESGEAQALVAGGLDNVRWDLLSDAAKGPTVWAALARKMGPQALRMNLNTLLRHDVFNVEQLSSTVSGEIPDKRLGQSFYNVEQLSTIAQPSNEKRLGQSFYNMLDYVAERIADESEIRRSKQFPPPCENTRRVRLVASSISQLVPC
ncbi:MAG: hypothetical protein ACK5YR_18170 [Pirellula sp.]